MFRGGSKITGIIIPFRPVFYSSFGEVDSPRPRGSLWFPFGNSVVTESITRLFGTNSIAQSIPLFTCPINLVMNKIPSTVLRLRFVILSKLLKFHVCLDY